MQFSAVYVQRTLIWLNTLRDLSASCLEPASNITECRRERYGGDQT